MKLRPLFSTLLATLFVAGCSTFNEAELGTIQRSGVSPQLVTKMQDGRPLKPEDVIELSRRGVSDGYILRQIDDAGIDYLLSPDDLKKLQRAGVSPAVLDALAVASQEFASRYIAPRYDMYPADPYYDDGYYYGRHQRPITGSVGIGFATGRHHHGRHP
jgi:hypothetical protein